MKRRHSQKREQILAVLERCRNPLSAGDIHEKLPEVDLTTIYRNLELFVEDGLVKKLNLGSEEAVYEYAKEAHHHAICTGCDRVIHFTAPDKEILKLLPVKGFKPEELEITIRGTCRH